jgi:hypothetical protein
MGGELIMQTSLEMKPTIRHFYRVECYDSKGVLKWEDGFENLVTTAGLNWYLDAALKTGVTSPLFSVGLKGTGGALAADTMAVHTNWSEITDYSNGTRPPWTSGAVASGTVDNSASKAGFNINATATVWGAFMVGVSGHGTVKGGANGTLLGAGDFTTYRIVQSGDTVNVTVTCTMS